MKNTYNLQAPKRATNLSINADLLSQAKNLNINLSAALEKTLAEMLAAKQREAWLDENKHAIDAYNAVVDEVGTFSDSLRTF